MTKLDSLMNNYYDLLTAHKAQLDRIYNMLIEIWSTSKKPKKIIFAEEKNYEDGIPIIFKREKYYVIGLELTKDNINISLRNYNTDSLLIDELLWYNNHELKTLIIDEVSRHLGYDIEIGGSIKKNNKKR